MYLTLCHYWFIYRTTEIIVICLLVQRHRHRVKFSFEKELIGKLFSRGFSGRESIYSTTFLSKNRLPGY